MRGAEPWLSQPEGCFASLSLFAFVCLCVQQGSLLSSARADAVLFLFKIPTSDFPFGFCWGFFPFLFYFPNCSSFMFPTTVTKLYLMKAFEDIGVQWLCLLLTCIP